MDAPLTQGIISLINSIHDQSMQHSEEGGDDITPNLETQFENEEIAYNSYNEYAKRLGFGIRKEYRNVSKKDGVLTSRRFSCHKEGVRSIDRKRDGLIKDARAETRTGCQARMIISLDRKVGKYKVVDFVAEHNHPLQPPNYVHMIRSQRQITKSQASEIDMANECGLTTRDFNDFMAKKAGGRDNLGFTKVDQNNYLRTKRTHKFKSGELNALLTYFKEQAKRDPSFFYELQMDNEDQVTNIFWADTQMINDYKYFGDVIVFDTTYRTNKGYRPLGVFVGYNNHRETVIFGAALLYDETIASFEWLFETFLKAMGGKTPKTILTDQDAAMANAIPSVMPQTFHGLCTWHIRENALRHVNHLYHDNPEFARDFEACIDVYENEDDFLNAWDDLILKNDIPERSWLHTIYEVKEKWAWAYVNKTFTAGMRSTQLSESLNADLKSHLKSDLNMVDFFTHFERVVNKKRYNESKAEHDSIHKLPRLKMKTAPMLVQAGSIYTPKIFEEFQEDYEEYQGAYIKDHKEDQSTHIYTVANVNETKERIVVSDGFGGTIGCACRKFETHGILCSHVLKVLDVMNIKLIPDRYILKRWTREARRGQMVEMYGQHKEMDMKAHFTSRYRELCPRIGNLVKRACESHETYTLISKVCEESTKIVEQILSKGQVMGEETTSSTSNISISMTNHELERTAHIPDYSNAKGIKKRQCPYKGRSRPKTWLEKSNRKANAKPRKKACLKTMEKKTHVESTSQSKTDITQDKQYQETSTQFMAFNQPKAQVQNYCVLDTTDNLTLTQLLTGSLVGDSEMFYLDNNTRASEIQSRNLDTLRGEVHQNGFAQIGEFGEFAVHKSP